MAEIKITSLAAISDPVSTDVLPIVDVSADITNKISIEDLLKNAVTGSASAPSFAFDADPNTGMYRSGADALAFSTGGTGRLFIDSSGNVKIGSPSTAAVFNVQGAAGLGIDIAGRSSDGGAQLRLMNNAGTTSNTAIFGGDTYGGISSATYLEFQTAGSPRMRIDSSGRVGIGTSLPSAMLHVNGAAASTSPHLRISADRGLIARLGDTSGSAQSLFDLYDTDGTTQIVKFISGSGADFINTGGNLGIGTTTPAYKFDCRGEAAIDLYNGSGGGGVLNFRPALGDANKFNMSISSYDHSGEGTGPADGVSINGYDGVSICTGAQTARQERLRVTQGGNVGIGTTSPDAILHSVATSSGAVSETLRLQNLSDGLNAGTEIVLASNNVPHVKIQQLVTGTTAGNRGSDCLFFTKADGGSISERMRIDSSGNVGIGTSSPGATFHLKSVSTNTSPLAHNYPATQSGALIENTTQTTGTFSALTLRSFNDNGYAAAASIICQSISTNYKPNILFTHRSGSGVNTELMRIDSSGRLLVGTTTEGAADADNLTVADSGDCGITIRSGTNSTGAIYFSDATTGGAEADGYIDYNQPNRYMRFGTGQAERMRLDISGRLLIGTSSDLSGGDADARLQVNGDAGAQILLSRQDFGALTAGTLIGEVVFRSQASGVKETSALIKCEADATQGSSDKPGRLVFSTTADSGNSPTERMRINRNGIVFIYTAYTYNATGTTRDVYVESGGAIGYVSSVREHKANIQSLDDVAWIYNLNPVSFNRRKRNENLEYLDEYYSEIEYGLIADEVENVQPEMCFYDELEDGGQKLAGVHYRQLVAPMLKALQQQKEQIETQGAAIAALEAKVAALESA